jgi:putative radical SAM enzyme (TIGR03279 family)
MNATISQITENSIAQEAGLQKGDVIVEMNGNPVNDVIDYMYYLKDTALNFKIEREGATHSIKIKRNPKERADLGIKIRPFRIKSCKNKCVFCFVRQLPQKMRKSLYLRDDDYRSSFLDGNYITLTNLTSEEKKRIFRQRLSPLYISVHTTNDGLRKKMLGNPKSPDILKEIADLAANKIRLHTQIVICPGMNDGEELSKTIKDLEKFYPYVTSIAVVPVGITKHRKSGIRPVEKNDAIKIIDEIHKIQGRLKRRHGDPLVYVADEFYIKAGIPFPPLKTYGDLPQIENGVGMTPLFLSQAKKLRLPNKIEPASAVATFTGASFMPFLKEFVERLNKIEGLSVDLFEVDNRFFGETVTVAGLLTGKDILKTVVGRTKAARLLAPDVALRESSNLFLDNVTLQDIEESLGMKVVPIESTPEGLLKGATDGCKWQD